MNRTQHILILLLAGIAAALVGWRAFAWRSAVAEFERAGTVRASVVERAARIAALRAQPAVSGFGARPADDVIPLVNRVLEAANIPAPRLRSVQAEADRAIADDRDGRRATTVRLVLEPLTVPELGAFLSGWRSAQQVWSVSRIDLTGAAPAAGASGAGRGGYRASITVTATYIDEAAPIQTSSTLLGVAQ